MGRYFQIMLRRGGKVCMRERGTNCNSWSTSEMKERRRSSEWNGWWEERISCLRAGQYVESAHSSRKLYFFCQLLHLYNFHFTFDATAANCSVLDAAVQAS